MQRKKNKHLTTNRRQRRHLFYRIVCICATQYIVGCTEFSQKKLLLRKWFSVEYFPKWAIKDTIDWIVLRLA